jgi:uncharacterized protein YfcZ (UPF0381/DUF406 family)
MDEYRHHVSGFFAHLEEAESALSRLVERAAANGCISSKPTRLSRSPRSKRKAMKC